MDRGVWRGYQSRYRSDQDSLTIVIHQGHGLIVDFLKQAKERQLA